MIIAKNDEEKRSKIWRMVIAGASIVLFIVIVYFLFSLFAGNPLEGIWKSEESNLQLTIRRRFRYGKLVGDCRGFQCESEDELYIR